jgi:flagellar P-ring protein precursor FlgI
VRSTLALSSSGMVARGVAAIAFCLTLFAPPCLCQTRIKDVASVSGSGSHKLIGYGLVVGLEGTGDSTRSIFTAQSVANMLEQFGLTVLPAQVQVKNVAAVIVTAELPAFADVGYRLDVTASSLGDAKSLQGGTLLMTPLQGGDGKVYAVAQGPISIGGFQVAAGGDKAQKNHVAVGRVPAGASVVEAVSEPNAPAQKISIFLNRPDFTTASRIADSINQAFGPGAAQARNSANVDVAVPEDQRANLTAFISRIEALPVVPDAAAKVVINERTGTVVIGQNVRVLPVAVSHGSLSVEVRAETAVSQPPPLSPGATVVTPQATLQVEEKPDRLVAISEQNTIEDVVRALNVLGVTPRDLIAILQAMRAANALQAELEIL